MYDPRTNDFELKLNTIAFQHAFTGMAVLSLQGTLVAVNPAFCKLFGYERDELVGRSLDFLRHPAEYSLRLPQDSETPPSPSDAPIETRFLDRNGKTVWVQAALHASSELSVEAIYILQLQDITEHKRVQLTADRSYRQMIDALESMTDGFFSFDSRGRFTYINSSAERFLVRSRNELIGCLFSDVLPESLAHAITNYCHLAANEQEPNVTEVYYEPRNRWIEMRAYLKSDSFTIYFRDVTERYQTGQALCQSEPLYRLIAEHASDVISMHAADGTCLYVSPSCFRHLGYTPDELIGRNKRLLCHPDDLQLIMEAEANMKDRKEYVFPVYRIVRKDGSYIWVESNVRRVDGPTPGFICISRDVTARKQAETQLLQSNERLQKISCIDSLTGVANRRGFDEVYAKEWSHGTRFSTPLSVILLDIDFFKRYNDNYGHHEGDYCLQQVAEALRRAAKRPDDLIARYGGEEFIIILPITNEQGAAYVAEKIRLEIERLQIPHKFSDVSHLVTASLGYATVIPNPEVSPHDLLVHADRALYQAKLAGRNQVCSFQTA